jgi:DNA (cytosine-5)-methyltransferase 1
MMKNDSAKANKRKELIEKFSFAEEKITEAENFFNAKKIPFTSKPDSSFTFIDLFAGIGGFRLAMQANGGECVFSSEWDDAAKQTYYENYGEVPFGDITKEETKALIPEHFDVLCAGFPCQPFSNAGLKKGIEDTRGTLFYHIAEILNVHKPKAVFLENVRGIISNDNGNTIRIVLKTITSMGYKCNISSELIENGSLQKLKTEAAKLVLSAKDYGVPQNRPRIYIVLWREDVAIENFLYPIPQKKKVSVGSILEKSVSNVYTISDRLWAGHQKRRVENQKKGNGFGYCLFNSESPYTSTISRRYYKDGSEILIEQIGKNPRKLTPREAANLQGFPKSFHIPQSDTKAYQQFGNSVAVPVVQLVSEQIVKQILEK